MTESKSHQVRQMKAIYSSAKIVLVWLGCIETGQSSGFMEFVDRYNQ